jgi:hypothetical protein
MRHLRRTTTLILIGALLLGGFGLARSHARDGVEAIVRGRAAGVHLAGRGGGPLVGGMPLLGGVPLLGALPIGTAVEVAFYDADPATGAAAVTTLALTVGVDSEVAFAADVAEARAAAAAWDVAYLVVSTGEQVRTVDLPDLTADADGARGAALRGAALRLSTAGLSEGDAIRVELYAGDPADGGAPLETLTFVVGVDSEIGFRAALRDAAEGAAAAVVTLPPRSATFDLGALSERMGDARAAMADRLLERHGAMAPDVRFGGRRPGRPFGGPGGAR